MNFPGAELLGYLASFMVLLSFFMKEITKLRILNSVGCFLFVVYGIVLDLWPVILTNAAIVVVHFWYLLKTKNGSSKKV